MRRLDAAATRPLVRARVRLNARNSGTGDGGRCTRFRRKLSRRRRRSRVSRVGETPRVVRVALDLHTVVVRALVTANCSTMAKVFEKAMDSLKGLAHDSTIEIHSQAEVTRYASSPMIAIGPTRAAAVAVIPARREKTFAFSFGYPQVPPRESRWATRDAPRRHARPPNRFDRPATDPRPSHAPQGLVTATQGGDQRLHRRGLQVCSPAAPFPLRKTSRDRQSRKNRPFPAPRAYRRGGLTFPPTLTAQGTGEAQYARRDKKTKRERERNPGVRGGQGERRYARV